MFRSEALLGAPIRFRGSIQGEALDTMVSAARSADFEQLALPLLPSLYNHAFWLARNHAEAEDLVQETFSKALRAFDSFQADTNFKGWIFRILRNTFLTSRSGIATSRTIFLEDHPDAIDATDTGPSPEDTLIRLDNQAARVGLHPRPTRPVQIDYFTRWGYGIAESSRQVPMRQPASERIVFAGGMLPGVRTAL
jgi:RNA polymerase sigma factor (sigma-70 family)